jgi:hypothetical protein
MRPGAASGLLALVGEDVDPGEGLSSLDPETVPLPFDGSDAPGPMEIGLDTMATPAPRTIERRIAKPGNRTVRDCRNLPTLIGAGLYVGESAPASSCGSAESGFARPAT